MSDDPNLNVLWCRALAEELRRGGVAHAVLCPGSRNAPLLFALAKAFGADAWSHIDERSAAFMALGAAKASGRPAVVCVTSGSAVANCAPALAEARAASLPLIVVAADRPWELHDRGAPQTMRQKGALRDFVVDELDLGEPSADDGAIRALRGKVSRIAQTRGPALIDVPLREPLTAALDPSWNDVHLSALARHGRDALQPYTVIARATVTPADAERGGVVPELGFGWLRRGLKGLIVVGAGAHGVASPWPRWLAQRTGYPLLADAPGGGRDADEVIALGDALVGGPLGDEAPELVIAFEQAPLSRALYEWLGRQRCPVLLIERDGDRDFLANAWAALPRPDAATFAAIADACGRGDAAWSERWRAAEIAARQRLRAAMASEPWGEVLTAHLAVNHPRFRTLHLASSMAVRHANLHLLPRAGIAVFANRGVNGIDGTLGTAIGAQRRAPAAGPGLLLCGDLAFLHDLPALAGLRPDPDGDPRVRDLTIVVLNNDGGGIFDFLPVAQADDYRRWVRTPHGMELAAIAEQFGLTYRRVGDRSALVAALEAGAGGPSLIECVVDPGQAVGRHRAVLKALAGR